MEATHALRSSSAIALLFAFAACAAPEDGPKVLMHSPRGRAFWTAPFPSDELRTADGTIDLSDFPNPDKIDLVTKGLEMIARDAKGFSTSGAIFFPLTGPVESIAPEHVVVAPLDDPSVRAMIETHFYEDARPYGPKNLLAVLPVQGAPLRPSTAYLAVVLKSAGLSSPDVELDVELLRHAGFDPDDVAGSTVFTTDDPLRAMNDAASRVLAGTRPSFEGPFVQRERFDEYCVYSSTISMPILFHGAALLDDERARVFVTLPRRAQPASGYPVLVFVRTGAGGDRPLVDRGKHAVAHGEAIAAGSGPALELARAGFAGVSFDGPHGGPFRNPNNQDEQFLIFNFLDPPALRDNVEQSALELILAAHLLDDITIDAADCPGVQLSQRTLFDEAHTAIMGHSMGATIAPLAVAFEPRYRAMVLSGAGGSWIENVVYKEKPIDVRPLAEQLLDYASRDRTLDEFDPVLTIVQWAIEPADPQVYAARVASSPERHILMLQGIVDHYILPPIANALSLPLGLDLAGSSLDRENAETARFVPLESRLSLFGRRAITFPVAGNASADGRSVTRVVVQNAEDGIEDGHEVVFQTDAPKALYRCFLETFASGGVPTVPAPDSGSCP